MNTAKLNLMAPATAPAGCWGWASLLIIAVMLFFAALPARAALTLSSFAPLTATYGDTITVKGSGFKVSALKVNFQGANVITINNSHLNDSDTSFTVKVPNDATTGKIKIAAGTQTAVISADVFTLTAPPPNITSISPSSGTYNNTITIDGAHFTGLHQVLFNGQALADRNGQTNDTRIKVNVPNWATTGYIQVSTAGGGLSTNSPNKFIVLPSITSVSPPNGDIGDSVTISGSAFTGATQVSFNGTPAAFTISSVTSITAKVPAGATSGPVKVTTPDGDATGPSFTVAVPLINSFSPASGGIGDTVTLSGAAFKTATQVTFNGVPAAFTINSGASITATVPLKASTGLIKVSTPSTTATSASPFTVNMSVGLLTLVGPPKAALAVYGAGFPPKTAVDVYFDTNDQALAIADANGNFSANLQVPATALPGSHWISAVGRSSAQGVQTGFTVNTDWAQYRNAPSHLAYNAVENVLSLANVAALNNDWTGATGDVVSSSPAVANGVVYVGSADKNLYAFPANCAAAPCLPLWIGKVGGPISSSPAVANGVVYVGSLGSLYAFPANCGTGGAACQPLWISSVPLKTTSSPAVANGVLYIGAADKNLYAFPANCVSSGGNSCNPLWNFKTGGSISSSPAVANGVVYVGSDDGLLYAFPANCGSNCKPLWTGNLGSNGSPATSSPAVVNGVVYIGSSNNGLYAFPASCGTGGAACKPLWIGAMAGTHSSPAVANGVVYIGSDSSKLYAFPANCARGGAACQPLWIGTADDVIAASPAVANGVVFVGSVDGNLYAFPANCGSGGAACSPVWSGWTGGAIHSSPAVANGVVYVGSDDGNLYAFDLNPSSQLSAFAVRPQIADLHPDLRLAPAH